VRRPDPRPLAAALEPVRRDLAPATTLARVQEAWAGVAGLAAKEATPVSERSGTVTFACRSSVWASELSLMAGDLKERLNTALGDRSVTDLRFVTRSS
jgi:predicted nucleic acid-binding Zn ribbon protein